MKEVYGEGRMLGMGRGGDLLNVERCGGGV